MEPLVRMKQLQTKDVNFQSMYHVLAQLCEKSVLQLNKYFSYVKAQCLWDVAINMNSSI